MRLTTLSTKTGQEVGSVADLVAGKETDEQKAAQGRVDQGVGLRSGQHVCRDDLSAKESRPEWMKVGMMVMVGVARRRRRCTGRVVCCRPEIYRVAVG